MSKTWDVTGRTSIRDSALSPFEKRSHYLWQRCKRKLHTAPIRECEFFGNHVFGRAQNNHSEYTLLSAGLNCFTNRFTLFTADGSSRDFFFFPVTSHSLFQAELLKSWKCRIVSWPCQLSKESPLWFFYRFHKTSTNRLIWYFWIQCFKKWRKILQQNSFCVFSATLFDTRNNKGDGTTAKNQPMNQMTPN